MKGFARFPRGDNYKNRENWLTKFKNSFFHDHLANLNLFWYNASLGKEDFKFIQMKGPALFKGEMVTKY